MITVSKYRNLISIMGDLELCKKCFSKLNISYHKHGKLILIRPIYFYKLAACLEEYGVPISVKINQNYELSFKPRENFALRLYQERIVERVIELGFRGLIVLPTGSGKTIVAMKLITKSNLRTLVVVPTIDLIHQWEAKMKEYLGVKDIGVYYSESKKIRDITITTYESASRESFQNNALDFFGLIIFDEVHNLLKNRFIEIPSYFVSNRLIGLTATINDDHPNYNKLLGYFGGLVKGVSEGVLEIQGYLEPVQYKRIVVELSEVEREYIKKLSRLGDTNWDSTRVYKERLIRLPKSKILELQKILDKHRNDKILIFTRFQDNAREIGRIFGLPVITSEIPVNERKNILELLRKGDIRIIVSAEALDEGIDIPDVNVVVIVSGRASNRQLVQRIGRVLRPSKRMGYVYELITKGTKEFKEHKKRHIF